MTIRALVMAAAAGLVGLGMTGCATDFGAVRPGTEAVSVGAMQGAVHGGQQPIVGAQVRLYAASTAGYKAASVLLTPVPAVTDANGGFPADGYLHLYAWATGVPVDLRREIRA